MWRRWTRLVILVGVALLAPVGCGGESATPGEVALTPTGPLLDAHRWLGEPVEVGNLIVWPVHTDAPLDVGEFLTLGEAEASGVAQVREVGTAAGGAQQGQVVEMDGEIPQEIPAEPRQRGRQRLNREGQIVEEGAEGNDDAPFQGPGGGAQVDTLVIENDGDLPILVCAGTIVKGGKQDRQIGQDFVIAAKTTVPVDAFCVEAGRWSADIRGIGGGGHSGGFTTGASFSSAGQGIAVFGARGAAQYEKSQPRVWEEVGKVLQDNDIEGTTTLVAANDLVDERVKARRTEMQQQVEAHFKRLGEGVAPPVGFAYAVEGKPVTVRAFAHRRLLEGQLRGFVMAMCLEAEIAERGRPEGTEAPAQAQAADVVAMVEAIGRAEETRKQTRALNFNGYRMAADGYNGRCYIPGKDEASPVEVTADWTAK